MAKNSLLSTTALLLQHWNPVHPYPWTLTTIQLEHEPLQQSLSTYNINIYKPISLANDQTVSLINNNHRSLLASVYSDVDQSSPSLPLFQSMGSNFLAFCWLVQALSKTLAGGGIIHDCFKMLAVECLFSTIESFIDLPGDDLLDLGVDQFIGPFLR